MKPEYIEIQGFGVFAEKVSIDFTKLGSSSIFLVNGNTGSGKTTIFDAITYALYGKPSGSIRDEENFRNNTISDDVDTFVKLIFVHKGKKYTAERTLKLNRKLKNPVRRYSVMKNEKGEVVAESFNSSKLSNRNDVNTYTEKLLGIDINEFRQIIMIAQGEFMSFLTAKNAVKEKILRKIFVTGKYENMELRLSEKKKNIENEINMISVKMNEIINNIVCEGYDCEYISRYKETEGKGGFAALEGIINETEKIISSDKNILKETNEEAEKNRIRNEELIKKVEKAKSDNEMLSKLFDADKRLKELEKLKEETEELSSRLDKYNYIIKNILPCQKEYSRLLNENNSREAELKDIYEKCREYQKMHEKAETDSENISSLNEKKDNLTLELSEIRKSFDTYEKALNLESSAEKLQKDIDEITRRTEKDEKIFADGKTKTDALKAEFSKYEDIENELLKANEEYGEKEKFLNNVGSCKKILNDAVRYENGLSKINDEFRIKNADFCSMEKEFLQSRADIIAKELKEGDICPVCGGIYHNRRSSEADEINKEAYERAKEERDKLKARIESGTMLTEEKINELRISIRQLFNEDIENINQAKIIIRNEDSRIKTEFDIAEKKLKGCSKGMERKKEISKDIDKLAGKKAEIQNSISENKIKLTKLSAELSGIEAEKEKVIKSLKFEKLSLAKENALKMESLIKNTASEIEKINKNLKDTSERLAGEKSLYENKKRELSALRINLENAFEAYKASAEKSAFGGIREYENFDNFTDEQAKEAEKRISQYDKETERLKTIRLTLEDSAASKEMTDIKKLEDEKKETDRILKELDIKKNKLSENISVNKSIPAALKKLKIDYEKAEEYYDCVNELYDTARGRGSKISFENYIQSHYFDMVIRYASARLINMTDGRYALLSGFNSENQSNGAGLDMKVYDYEAEAERDVNTFSGGELFEAALCLALGFSDVVQMKSGGVDIDAMYIDEGFGTLDEASLERAVNVLESITNSDRVIGVISHRPELSEKIRNKITVVNKDKKSFIRMNGE